LYKNFKHSHEPWYEHKAIGNTQSFSDLVRISFYYAMLQFTLREKVGGRSTSSHDNKKFRTRSVEKQRGKAFGFRKTAKAVIKPDR
jgi:hypothetical protein